MYQALVAAQNTHGITPLSEVRLAALVEHVHDSGYVHYNTLTTLYQSFVTEVVADPALSESLLVAWYGNLHTPALEVSRALMDQIRSILTNIGDVKANLDGLEQHARRSVALVSQYVDQHVIGHVHTDSPDALDALRRSLAKALAGDDEGLTLRYLEGLQGLSVPSTNLRTEGP